MLFKVFIITTVTIYLTVGYEIVSLPDGQVRGEEKLTAKNRTFYAFFQIPYAEPPVGQLRFKEPQPAKKWKDVLNATQEKTTCYQVFFNSALESEDCLNLNVYVPESPGRRPRGNQLPVMVYIYGGGFMNGVSLFSFYGPHHLMDNGVIVVTVSYRLGPFGFLSTGDEVIPGNYGLKDQNLALKWVQKNIRYFGGDPNKVTIFGQSSGAVSVGYHIISKQSKGLFVAAIQQSGSVITPHGYQRRAKYYAYTLAQYIDPNFNMNSSSTELLSFLRNASADAIDKASSKFTQAPGNTILSEGSWFAPVIEPEHEGAFITENMYESVANGNINAVPLMIGMTSEEALSQSADLVTFKSLVEQYDNNPSYLTHGDMHITDTNTRTEAGRAIRKIYTNGLLQDNLGAATRYFSDAYVSKCVLRQAQLQSNYSDVYFYEFSYSGALGGNNVYVEGAGRVTHSEDNKYLWVTNNTFDINNVDTEDLQTLDRFLKLFTNFAKESNPTPNRSRHHTSHHQHHTFHHDHSTSHHHTPHHYSKKDPLGNTTWPKVTPENIYYLDIGKNLEVKSNPKEAAYKGWVSIYDKWGVPPFDTF